MHGTETAAGRDAVNVSECLAMQGEPWTEIAGAVYNGVGGPLLLDEYWMRANIEIPTGESLTVGPGAVIQVKRGTHITALGEIVFIPALDTIRVYSDAPTNQGLSSETYLTIRSGGVLRILDGGELNFE